MFGRAVRQGYAFAVCPDGEKEIGEGHDVGLQQERHRQSVLEGLVRSRRPCDPPIRLPSTPRIRRAGNIRRHQPGKPESHANASRPALHQAPADLEGNAYCEAVGKPHRHDVRPKISAKVHGAHPRVLPLVGVHLGILWHPLRHEPRVQGALAANRPAPRHLPRYSVFLQRPRPEQRMGGPVGWPQLGGEVCRRQDSVYADESLRFPYGVRGLALLVDPDDDIGRIRGYHSYHSLRVRDLLDLYDGELHPLGLHHRRSGLNHVDSAPRANRVRAGDGRV
mmetsp:Transcript_30071/g.82587  ORF Transcript_30071/g.82587 Transcript_30071/m.82587 type:complete len:279 (-) Transcript_30071:1062-1898(-)